MTAEYYYRRRLGGADLLPAIGAGVAAGLAVFYVARLFLARTPLVASAESATSSRFPHHTTAPRHPE